MPDVHVRNRNSGTLTYKSTHEQSNGKSKWQRVGNLCTVTTGREGASCEGPAAP
jgi:hypothetical protein